MVQQALMLAQSALGKVNSISTGSTTTVDARVSPMSQSLGITFDSTHNIIDNTTNANILDLQTRLTNLENRLAQYENHTHSYVDTTIADTDDGSGTSTDTSKTTGIVI